MKVIGLTGSIASGKSTVAAMLRNSKIIVIDADDLARQVTLQNSPCFSEIVKHFGPRVLSPDGNLNRKVLADIVFNNPKALRDLEKIIHPAIEVLRLEEIKRAQEEGREVVVYMAPLLLEKNIEAEMDKTILVIAPEELQINRLIERDGMSKEEAKKRLGIQLSNEEKMHRADEIIINDGTLAELFTKLQKIWKRLCNSELIEY